MSSREASSRNSSDEDDDDDGESKGDRTDGDKTENEDEEDDEDDDKTENEEEDDDDNEGADKTDNEEGEENNGNDGDNNEKGGKKHVSFKEGPIDQIKAVHQEINSISSNIDMFLLDLAPSSYKSRYPPITNQSYLSQSPFQTQQYQPNATFQNPNNNTSYSLNVSRQANPPGSVQQFSVGSGSTAQSRYGNSNNKFFYSKNDMSSANKPNNTQGFMPTSQVAASNYQSQLFAANLRAAGLTSSPKEQETNEQNNPNERRESKFNYYGQYRFRADREGLNSSNNNPSYVRQSSFTAQAPQQPVRDKFEKRVDKINSEIDVLAQSINIDQSEQPIFKGGINPALYRRVNQLQAIQQGGGVNERPFLMERRNSSSRSSRTSETQFRPQNPKDLYRYRPKRIIEESELYGEITQVNFSKSSKVHRARDYYQY